MLVRLDEIWQFRMEMMAARAKATSNQEADLIAGFKDNPALPMVVTDQWDVAVRTDTFRFI
jgi:hypothetical protein